MKIPDKIKVGGHTIKIEKVLTDITANSGSYQDWYDLIRINIDQTSDTLQSLSFLHEIIESINTKFELKLEHQAISVLSEMLFSIIRDNNLDFR